MEGKEDDVINIHKIPNNVHDIKDDDVINIPNLAHNIHGISQTSINDTSSTSHDSKNQVNNSLYVIDVKTEQSDDTKGYESDQLLPIEPHA